jgi:predicted amidohydrolase
MSLPTHDPIPAPYRVAAIQFEPAMFAKAANIEKLLALCEEAAANGARLIVTPEMATTGYCWASRAEVAPEVEPIPGPTTDRFAALAARRDCWIVVSLPEVAPETGVYYNSAVLIGPNGIEGLYRKTHSYISEPKWAKDGDLGLPIFETPLGRIALTICMDACYPETTRIPAVNGADVICFPTNWLSEKAPSPSWIARALESGVWFISANRWGVERGVQFDGGSCVIAPDGAIQAALDVGDGIVYGEIDVARARDKRPRPGRSDDLRADRRPELYGNLTLNAYLWNAREFHGLYDLRPLPEGRRSRVAVAQFAPAPGDVAANLERIDAALAESGAELLVAPELSVTGPVADRGEAERLAEPIDGPIVARLREIATRHGAFVVAGLAERDGADLFNTAALVGPEGLVGRYRKTHLADEDRAWATAGDDGLPTFDLPVGRIGLLIGYDALFPETARSLALDGADLIACPSLLDWPAVQPWGATAIPLPPYLEAGPTADHFHLWRERGRENNTYIAFANGAAPWMGWSGVFGAAPEDEPRQEAVIAEAAPGAATLTIDTTNLDARSTTNPVRAKDLVRMRMPIWYDPLQAPAAGRAAAAADAREMAAAGAGATGRA